MILLARAVLAITWLYWPVCERAVAGTIIAGDISPWPVGRLFASLGVTALLAATPALVGRKSDAEGWRDYHADGTSGIGYFPDVGAYCASGGVARNMGWRPPGRLLRYCRY